MHSNESATSPHGHRLQGYMDYQGMGMGLKSQYPVEKKWALGLQVKFVSSFNTDLAPYGHDVMVKYLHS